MFPVFRSVDDLAELFHQLPHPFLLLDDLNISDLSFDNTVTFLNPAVWVSVTSEFSFCILNSGLPTLSHRSTDSFSYVDLSICSSSIVFNFMWSL